MLDQDNIKEQVRQGVDLVEVVAEHVALTRSGNSFRGLCPFHKETAPSFHVIPAKGIFHCFGCKAGGDVFKFVQLREGVSFPEAVRLLADRAGIAIPTRGIGGASGPSRTSLAQTNAWAADYYVATDGNDTTGDGSEPNPWLTINHGGGQLSAGDTLIVKVGTCGGPA